MTSTIFYLRANELQGGRNVAMSMHEWAIKWGVPFAALRDLEHEVFNMSPAADPEDVSSEAAAQAQVRLEASEKGCRLWRNNVGVLPDATGRPVRYGLANDSKQLNTVIKSSDLIGIRPILIGPRHIGQVIGQFIGREMKAPGWSFTGSKRESAQLEWAKCINALGGDAKFATGRGTL